MFNSLLLDRCPPVFSPDTFDCPSGSASENGDPPLSVLVVEDQVDSAESMTELLTLCGCDAQIAASGEEALKVAAANPPDVVLLDIGLPGMNGWEAARRLRDQIVRKQPVIVAITGRCGKENRGHSADAGIDIHLDKPTNPAKLVQILKTIRKILAARGATRGRDDDDLEQRGSE